MSDNDISAPNPIRTCVLGVGLGGLVFHIPFILAQPHLFSLHAVLERSGEGKAHARYGAHMSGAKIYTSMEQVVADPEIELVVVTTPNGTHYALARSALEAGKHVLVDKPVTATAQEARELGELAKSRNLVLAAYQNKRYEADWLALKKLLALPRSSPHSLGDIYEFESRADRYRAVLKGTWKDHAAAGTGLTYDLGSHLIDQALQLFGRPDKITAFIQNIRGIGDPEVDDCFTIYFHYSPLTPDRPCPITVILRSHILSVGSPQLRYVVRGTKGTYTKYGADGQEEYLRSMSDTGQIVRDEAYGMEKSELAGTLQNLDSNGSIVTSRWQADQKGTYADLYSNVWDAIRNGKELVVKWTEATAVVEMIELAYLSQREGRTVDVP
ncbi:NAD P-binding protein [Gloeophyllum trabeum ATCC 11539]|uniref:NAD P-binding protein n=1 Tax=Gloeophyllum trabeum (strain ATCC 11539 / FP-39264 / Madison 617) TaxID=670483 RepID=S7QJ29_GLOTA|nr:NAD P-binding protein [Gloeophyllum trabeum ATCC 11539]EPQ59348.1 NAD P-binding protein [Gloeophyllum trabeum ATCC 11539]